MVGAGLALLALSPLLIAIAIAIKLDSRGPVFFRQPRAGRGGKFFKLSSSARCTPQRDRSRCATTGRCSRSRDDPRITRVGRVIRRFSLDELPQLFNVLKGEMSLVGPRPLVMPEAQTLTESWHARRLDLRPGLTGPWQISGPLEHPLPGDGPLRLPVRRRLVAGARHRDPARHAPRGALGPRRVLTPGAAHREAPLIDLHCHVLPGIDDGPDSDEGALALARVAVALGTHVIVATPHRSPRWPTEPAAVTAGAERLAGLLAAAGIDLELYTGAEIALEEAGRLDDATLSQLALGHGHHLLLESPHGPAGDRLEHTVSELLGRGHGIVLAHPERSPVFQDRPGAFASWSRPAPSAPSPPARSRDTSGRRRNGSRSSCCATGSCIRSPPTRTPPPGVHLGSRPASTQPRGTCPASWARHAG